MPICSQCSQEKSRDAFTKAQLRKTDVTRRCKQCVDAEFCRGISSFTNARQTMNLRRRGALERHNESLLRGGRVPGGDERQGVMSLLWKLFYWVITSMQRMIFGYQLPQLPPHATEIRQLVSAAVQEILKRGVPLGVGLDGFNTQELEARLWDVSNNKKMSWLIEPLLIDQSLANLILTKKYKLWQVKSPIQSLYGCVNIRI